MRYAINDKRLRTALWLASAVGFCLLGQYYFNNLPEYRVDAAIFYAVGLFSFWRVLTRVGAPTSPAPRPADMPFEPVSWRWPFTFASLGFAAVAYWASANNTFTNVGVVAWAGAVLFFLIALWPKLSSGLGWLMPLSRLVQGVGAQAEGLTLRLRWRTAALLAIMALAAFFYLYRLEHIPPEMTSDHIEKLLDIHDLANGARPIYFERNTGREPFQFYWALTVMRVFNTGLTFYGLKLANALIGLVTIYGIYLLGRELAGKDVGLLAAFFAAVMQWAVSITRMGLRFPYAAIAATFALWTLLRALRSPGAGRRADYLIAGLIFGAGFYGYTPFRIMPLAVIVLVLLKLIVDPPRSRPAWSQLIFNLVVFSVIAIIVLAPLGRYWHDRPESFWYRSVSRIEGERGITAQDVWLTLGHNTLRAMGMFNIVGDSVWANTVPNKPAFDEVGGAFFLMGVLAALYRLVKHRDWPLLMVMSAGFVLLFPSILSLAFPNENPSVVRAAGAIPVAAVLVALGMYATMWAVIALGGARWKWLAAPLVALALVATMRLNYQRYFVSYLQSYQLSSQNSSEMAEAMRGFIATGGDLKHITIRAWPHWVDTRALALIVGDVSWQNTNVVIDRINDLTRLRDDPLPQMYILHVSDKDGLALLHKTFPSGYVTRHRSPIPGHDFILFLVPARE